MTYRHWEVIAVHFPFIEGGEAKKRPAMIVSSDDLYATHNVVWAAMITTAKSGARRDDIAVTDRHAAGLPEHCVIRLSRLATLSDAQLSHRMGAITPQDRNAVAAVLGRFPP